MAKDVVNDCKFAASRLRTEFFATPLQHLLQQAQALRARGHGNIISYSPKVFIPLTRLCRDVCGYCTFARKADKSTRAFLTVADLPERAQVAAVTPRAERQTSPYEAAPLAISSAPSASSQSRLTALRSYS